MIVLGIATSTTYPFELKKKKMENIQWREVLKD